MIGENDMNKSTMKILLLITICLAVANIVIKTISNTGYYRVVKAIKYNFSQQNPIDYGDEN